MSGICRCFVAQGTRRFKMVSVPNHRLCQPFSVVFSQWSDAGTIVPTCKPRRSHDDRGVTLFACAEHPAIAFDLFRRANGLERVVSGRVQQGR